MAADDFKSLEQLGTGKKKLGVSTSAGAEA